MKTHMFSQNLVLNGLFRRHLPPIRRGSGELIKSIKATLSTNNSIGACSSCKGIVIGNFYKTGCVLEFTRWNTQSRYELFLHENEELQINIACESGSIGLDIRSKSGTEAYSGNSLNISFFTVKMLETGEYIIKITGENATGSVIINRF